MQNERGGFKDNKGTQKGEPRGIEKSAIEGNVRVLVKRPLEVKIKRRKHGEDH